MLDIISSLFEDNLFPVTNKRITAVLIYQNAEDNVSDTIKQKLKIHKIN